MREIKQDAAANVMVLMVDSGDHVTGATGLTLTITASKDGGAFAAITPDVTERGNGWYSIALTSSHTDTPGDLALHITASGADPADVLIDVSPLRGMVQELHAAEYGPRDHDIETATGRVFDTDGNLLATLTVASAITVTGANWTDATKTLTKAGAFAGYIFRAGDVINVTGGTGVMAGQYTIASRVSDDAITLVEDLNGPGADIADSSISANIPTGRAMRTRR